MKKNEALKLIDDHKNRMVDPLAMLRWTWIRVIIQKIPDPEWEKYVLEACETLAK